jgi:acyl carrier protein
VSTAARDDVVAVLLRELHATKRGLPAHIDESARFTGDLGLDSLDLTEYIARMDQAFHVRVPDAEWKTLTTFGSVVDYVIQRLDT